jgi:hypothetical protein
MGRLAIFTTAVLSFSLPLPAQIDNLQIQRQEVVKLKVKRKGLSDEVGAAILVGRDQSSAYFATAYHSIRPRLSQAQDDCSNSFDSFGAQAPSPSVEIQLFSSPQPFKAEILDNFDLALDLGVVALPIGSAPAGLPQIPLSDAVPDTQIHIIGHPAAGPWTVWVGTLTNENGPNGDFHRFTTTRDPSLTGGFSGGAVFDSHGSLYGIHVCTTPSYGKALKVRDIVAELSAWHVPTNNLIIGTVTNNKVIQATILSLNQYFRSIQPQGREIGMVAEPTFTLNQCALTISDPSQYGMNSPLATATFDLTRDVMLKYDVSQGRDWSSEGSMVLSSGLRLWGVMVFPGANCRLSIAPSGNGRITNCGGTETSKDVSDVVYYFAKLEVARMFKDKLADLAQDCRVVR